MSRALVISTAILTILRSYVSAQTPTCLSGYGWSFNSLGQSPCNMSDVLGGVCSNGAFDLPPLSGPYVAYAGPQDHADPCICSTVLYSLMSACAYCQNASYFNWSTFHVNCTVVYPQVFPSPLPSSIVVPHYAYLDVVTNDTFDVTAAMSASGPESSPVPQSTTSTNPTVTSTPILTPSTSVASSSKKLNAGAIAGGVVGGVVGIIIVAGLISAFVVLRCLKRQSVPQYMMDDGAG